MNTDERRYKIIRDYAIENNLKACFILGGGPSLYGFDFNRLNKEFTLAINHSIEFYPRASACLFGDKIFLSKTKFDFNNYPGMVFAGAESGHQDKYKGDRTNWYIFKINRKEPCLNPKVGLYHPTCGGLYALNLALQMGFKKIYLMGYDFYYSGGNTHFYGNVYEHHTKYPETKLAKKAQKFILFKEWQGRVYNCNPKSNLRLFRFRPYEEVFK